MWQNPNSELLHICCILRSFVSQPLGVRRVSVAVPCKYHETPNLQWCGNVYAKMHVRRSEGYKVAWRGDGGSGV